MRIPALLVAAVALSPFCFAQTSTKPAPIARDTKKPETSHLAFVTEYIREMAAIESIRASAEQELKPEDANSEVFSNAIHSSTLFQLELRSQIGMLKGMRLDSPYDELVPGITAFYERKIDLWQKMIDIESAFIVPKPDVDYGKLAAEMPQIRAQLDYIDHALFEEVTPLVFSTLINLKRADSENHASHLIITKAERATLIANLTDDFGEKLDQPNQNFTISAAKILKDKLNEFKCSDDPWE